MERTLDFNDCFKWVDTTCNVIQSVGKQYYGVRICKKERMSLELLKKVNANLEVVRDILKEFNNKDQVDKTYEKKIPLSILFRTCLADCLTGLYLLSSSETEFNEELDVLELDCVKYIKDMLPLEIEFFNFLHNENKNPQTYLDERYDGFKRLLIFKKGEPWKLKHPKDFRSDKKNNAKITFPAMHKKLKGMKGDIKTLAYMYNIYRNYSQYEHFTLTGSRLVNSFSCEEVDTMERCIIYIRASVIYIAGDLQNADTLLKPLFDEINSMPKK